MGTRKTEPVGGVARFYSALLETRKKRLKSQEEGDALTLFSGDLFNPCVMSVSTKGEHLIPFVNKLGIDVACYGNHGKMLLIS